MTNLKLYKDVFLMWILVMNNNMRAQLAIGMNRGPRLSYLRIREAIIAFKCALFNRHFLHATTTWKYIVNNGAFLEYYAYVTNKCDSTFSKFIRVWCSVFYNVKIGTIEYVLSLNMVLWHDVNRQQRWRSWHMPTTWAVYCTCTQRCG